ncbi:DMT family transporter [Mariniflexile aquimaris]|uniref:DMT family transporter n=1 Tax=Mariniflexile aquimaris TaxID=881009 RepID=A0ABW3BQ00_9FLAO
MKKPRLALFVGVICISIFPILVKLSLTSGLISAFYRMLFSFLLLLPYVLFKKQFALPSVKIGLLAALCGVIFGSDVAVWNIAIQESTATQASLLTNLSPVWVGFISLFFLKDKPKTNFWIGTTVAVFGMVLLVGFSMFKNLDFDLAFNFAVLSGMLYAVYMLLSKHILNYINVTTFMLISLGASSVYLGVLNFALNEAFFGFSTDAWLVLLAQAVICQLLAWLLISYATQHMRATRVSVSLLGQGVLASVLAWLLLDETITIQMCIGGFILLWGIRITFYNNQILAKNWLKKRKSKALFITRE